MIKVVGITHEFRRTLDNPSKPICMINAHLQVDSNTVLQCGYMLMRNELDPNYMTTDRLYELLSSHYKSCHFIGFETLLDDFVVEFITHIRGMTND